MISEVRTVPKFSPGQILMTANAQKQLSQTDVQQALRRHFAGDWGDCDPEDTAANEDALLQGDRLLSVYHTAEKVRFWVITEADRSATTVLLPGDY